MCLLPRLGLPACSVPCCRARLAYAGCMPAQAAQWLRRRSSGCRLHHMHERVRRAGEVGCGGAEGGMLEQRSIS